MLYILPLQIFALQKVGMSRFQTYITYLVRAVSVLMIPVAATVPSVSKHQYCVKHVLNINLLFLA